MTRVEKFSDQHTCNIPARLRIIKDPVVRIEGWNYPLNKVGWWFDMTQAVLTDDLIAMCAISYCPFCGQALYVKA